MTRFILLSSVRYHKAVRVNVDHIVSYVARDEGGGSRVNTVRGDFVYEVKQTPEQIDDMIWIAMKFGDQFTCVGASEVEMYKMGTLK